MGRAQQMMMEHLARADGRGGGDGGEGGREAPRSRWPGMNLFGDPAKLMEAQARMWSEGLDIWQRALGGGPAAEKSALAEKADKDRRFAAPEWRDNPLYDTIRQTYLLVSERLLGSVDAIEGVDEETREKMRFMTRAFVDAMAPSQLRADQPAGDRAGDGDQGREPAQGARTYAGATSSKGQLTHVDTGRVRGRAQHRDDAGQGDQADRACTS